MRIAVFTKSPEQNLKEVFNDFFDSCKKFNIDYFVNKDFEFQFLSKKHKPENEKVYTDKKDLLKNEVDYFISIGGDGTFLEAMLIVKDSGIPMLGINTGRLGFLANNPSFNFDKLFKELVDRNYSIENRTLLNLKSDKELFGEYAYALNDFTIHKRDNSSLTEIRTYINDIYFNTYWGDGLIISTPTGSSAYSMSCGGPIVFPDSNVLIITPVAPHNLSTRPVIIADDYELSFKVKARERNFLVTLDSRYKVVDESYQIKIRKAQFFIKTIRFNNQSFSDVIREKLGWGKDNRNN